MWARDRLREHTVPRFSRRIHPQTAGAGANRDVHPRSIDSGRITSVHGVRDPIAEDDQAVERWSERMQRHSQRRYSHEKIPAKESHFWNGVW